MREQHKAWIFQTEGGEVGAQVGNELVVITSLPNDAECKQLTELLFTFDEWRAVAAEIDAEIDRQVREWGGKL